MTTTVKVQAHGHRVKVTSEYLGVGGAANRSEETILEPGTGERTFYVHDSLNLHVEEIAVEKAEKTDEA